MVVIAPVLVKVVQVVDILNLSITVIEIHAKIVANDPL